MYTKYECREGMDAQERPARQGCCHRVGLKPDLHKIFIATHLFIDRNSYLDRTIDNDRRTIHVAVSVRDKQRHCLSNFFDRTQSAHRAIANVFV